MPDLNITVVFALPDEQHELPLQMAAGSTVGQALERAALDPLFAQFPVLSSSVGVFGEVCGPQRELKDQDRVEIYRPLRLDPKEARRQRAKATG